MIDWTKPIQTSDGRRAKYRGVRKTPGGYQHLVLYEEGDQDLVALTDDAGFVFGRTICIVNVPARIQGYVNVYRSRDPDRPHCLSGLMPDKATADEYHTPSRVARIKIDVEEGRFDE